MDTVWEIVCVDQKDHFLWNAIVDPNNIRLQYILLMTKYGNVKLCWKYSTKKHTEQRWFYQSFIFLVQLLCFVICLTSCAAQSYLQMHSAIKSKVELTKYWEPRDKIESKWNFCHCHRGRAGQSKMKEWLVFNSLKLHQTRKTLVPPPPPPPPALFLASGKMIFCWQKHLKGCNN